MSKCKHARRYVVDTDDSIRCRRCTQHLPIGPSNDDVPPKELEEATFAKDDEWWDGLEWGASGGFDWDPSRPLADQRPWNGHASPEGFAEHMAKGDAMLDEAIAEQTRHDVAASVVRHDALAVPARETAPDAFAPVDTASREPWHADVETQGSEGDAVDDEETRARETVA